MNANQTSKPFNKSQGTYRNPQEESDMDEEIKIDVTIRKVYGIKEAVNLLKSIRTKTSFL